MYVKIDIFYISEHDRFEHYDCTPGRSNNNSKGHAQHHTNRVKRNITNEKLNRIEAPKCSFVCAGGPRREFQVFLIIVWLFGAFAVCSLILGLPENFCVSFP